LAGKAGKFPPKGTSKSVCSGSQALLGNPSLGSSASRCFSNARQAELAKLHSQAELGNKGKIGLGYDTSPRTLPISFNANDAVLHLAASMTIDRPV
jgi:hypothetical protein